MKIRFTLLFAVALLSACATASISQTLIARPLLNETTVGGPGYPVVVRGAEEIGLTPVIVAQSLRFPARLTAGSSFRAVGDRYAATNRAELDISSSSERDHATLTFLHGERRTGVGTFSLPHGAFADPAVLGTVSATLIAEMLEQAREQSRRDPDWKF